jgi:hypothetical protein
MLSFWRVFCPKLKVWVGINQCWAILLIKKKKKKTNSSRTIMVSIPNISGIENMVLGLVLQKIFF